MGGARPCRGAGGDLAVEGRGENGGGVTRQERSTKLSGSGVEWGEREIVIDGNDEMRLISSITKGVKFVTKL